MEFALVSSYIFIYISEFVQIPPPLNCRFLPHSSLACMPASNGEAPQNGTGYAICYKKK